MIDTFDVFKDESNGCFQLRTKTNAYVLEFDDPEKEQIFLKIVDNIQKNPGISLQKIHSFFQENQKEKVTEVLSTLNEHAFLPSSLYMEMNKDTSAIEDKISRLTKVDLGIVGEGAFFELLYKKANALSFRKVSKYNYSKLRSEAEVENLIQEVDFLVVDANQWSPFHLEIINRMALKHNKPWLHVGGLEEINLKVGPLFYGKETGCYNCLISRLKSNHEYPEMLTSYEAYLTGEKKASRPDQFPNMDVLYALVSDLSLLEVTKFYEEWSLPLSWRTVLSFDIITYQMTKHNLLKKPFCESCKPQLEYNPSPWLEAITLK